MWRALVRMREGYVNARKHNHWTPLHCASQCGHFEVVEALLKQGANVGARNDEGRTSSQ